MSTLSFTAFTEKQTNTHITWNLGEISKELQEHRVEYTNGDDLYFQFKFFYHPQNSEDKLKFYFRCRNKVHIKSIKYSYGRHNFNLYSSICNLYDKKIIQPYMWLFIAEINRFEIRIITLQITTTSSEEIDPPFILESRLYRDFKNLLHCGSNSDAIMKSADGDAYKVHKTFLTSRSPVLKAHFEHNTTESVTNIIESPLESKVLNEMITFIYTDQAPNIAEMPEKLLAAANFYQLDRLKGLSEEVLNKNLTAANALETLQLAELYSCENLKKLTLQFIKDDAHLVTKTEAWAKVNSLELIKNLFEYVTKEEYI